MNIGSTVFAGLLLAAGLVYESMALNMPRGTLAYPGPGLFPLIIGAFMMVMALGCLLQEIVPRMRERMPEASSLPSADAADSEARDVAKTFQLTALMIAYIFLPQVAADAGHGCDHRRHLLRFVRPLAQGSPAPGVA
jgi:hypothetical protein